MKYIAILYIVLFSTVATAQTSNAIIENLISKTLDASKIPAISASLITSDSIYFGTKGDTKFDGVTKVTPKSKFHLGSNSKAITSFIAMKMIENGEVRLNSKFTDVFPEVKIKDVYNNITLGELLSHQAGIQPYTSGLEFKKLNNFKGTTPERRQQFVEFVLNESVVDKGTYSNAGYVIVSLMLEKIAGISFEELLKKHLSTLNLDFFIGFPNKETENNPAGHWREKGKIVTHLPNHSYKLEDYMVSAGDISMNIIDYSNFIQLHLQGLKKGNYLTKEAYQKLHFGKKGYAYGWKNSKIKTLVFSAHNGSTGTYFCHTILIPKVDTAVIVMSNSADKNQQKAIYNLREEILKNLKKIKNEV